MPASIAVVGAGPAGLMAAEVLATGGAGQMFAASSLFSVTDADNDALTYFLYDWSPAANSGHLVVNGNVVRPRRSLV